MKLSNSDEQRAIGFTLTICKYWPIVRAFLWVASFFSIYFLTSQYFRHTLNADFANSPLVWREFVNSGIHALYDWKPTPDSWYFTVYPVNFLMFWALGDDGITPLIISTALFTWTVAVIASTISEKLASKTAAVLVLLALTFLPELMYTRGFVQHPFSHNSTSAFGMIVFLLAIYNYRKDSLMITVLTAFVAWIATSSDMWLVPSYFLPVIFSELYLIFAEKRRKTHLPIYVLFFILGLARVLPNIFGIAIQQIRLAPLHQMITNTIRMFEITGKSLNIFISDSGIANYASLFVWLVALTFGCVVAYRKGGTHRYTVLIFALSILGVASSFILTSMSTKNFARFFVNIIPCAIVLLSVSGADKHKAFTAIPLLLMVITSLVSYDLDKTKDDDKIRDLQEYMTFLDNHDLHFGYGDFWNRSIEVMWLSGGRKTIIPVLGDDRYGIKVTAVRWQNMRSWHSKEFLENAPDRQFIAVAKSNSCNDVETCIGRIVNSYGKPDEVLRYKETSVLVYNQKIQFKK